MAVQQRHNEDKPKRAAQQPPQPTLVSQGPVALPELGVPGVLQRAVTRPDRMTPGSMQMLQRAFGNRAVTGLLSGASRPVIQTELRVCPARDRYEKKANRVAGWVMGVPGRPPVAVHRLGRTAIQRYWYRFRTTDDPYEEAIKYEDDYDPSKAPNLKPDQEINYWRTNKTKHHYINSQTGKPIQGAYVKGLVDETQEVIDLGQQILDTAAKSTTEDPEKTSYMIGVMRAKVGERLEQTEIRVTSSGKGMAPKFEHAVKELNQLRTEQLRMVEEVPQKGPKHHTHLACAAPKLISSLGKPKEQIASMTEIYWNPEGGRGVLVDNVRYHHRQRVPSCEKCESNLRLLVFKALQEDLKKVQKDLIEKVKERRQAITQVSQPTISTLGTILKVVEDLETNKRLSWLLKQGEEGTAWAGKLSEAKKAFGDCHDDLSKRTESASAREELVRATLSTIEKAAPRADQFCSETTDALKSFQDRNVLRPKMPQAQLFEGAASEIRKQGRELRQQAEKLRT